jgi:hypothetical protein
MDFGRATLVILLPTLWLLASGHYLLDQADRGIVGPNVSSISIAESGKHSLLDDAVNAAARRLNRRCGFQLNPDGPSLPGDVSLAARPSPENSYRLLTASVAPLGLAESWQFHWRTALEARAPSRAS